MSENTTSLSKLVAREAAEKTGHDEGSLEYLLVYRDAYVSLNPSGGDKHLEIVNSLIDLHAVRDYLISKLRIDTPETKSRTSPPEIATQHPIVSASKREVAHKILDLNEYDQRLAIKSAGIVVDDDGLFDFEVALKAVAWAYDNGKLDDLNTAIDQIIDGT